MAIIVQNAGRVALTFSKAFDPSQLAGLKLWLRSDLGVTLSGANVTQWNDQSGNGLNVVPGGFTSPTYSATGGPNGLPHLSFVTGQGLINTVTNVVAPGTARTIWMLLRNNAGVNLGGEAFSFTQASGFRMLLYFGGGSGKLMTDLNTYTNLSSYLGDGTYHLAEYDYITGVQSLYTVDGISQTVTGGAAGTETGAAGFMVGHGVSIPWNGDTVEVVVTDHLATAAEQFMMHRYAQLRYNTP